MSIRQFDLNLLRLFEALISEAHVSRAAEKVFLSQSAMSHALNRLREQLNDPLLVRTEHGLQPTPRALKMLPEVRNALQLVEQTLNPPPPFDPASSERTFRIACTDYFETVVFPEFFSRLQNTAPNLKIEIDLIAEETARSRIEKGTIDLIVGMETEQTLPGHLIRQLWLTEKQVCLASNQNTALPDSLTLKQFLAQKHILFSDLEGETESNIDRWLKKKNMARQHISRTTNYMTAARIVATTNAIATLPCQMAQLFSTMLPLRIVQPPKGMPQIEMTLVQHPLYANDPGITWLKREIMGFGYH